LALGQSGVPVLMHGTNEFSGGMTVAAALARLGVPLGGDLVVDLTLRGFVYVPVERLHARFAALLGLRRVLGLRSPLNTVARLLNPAGAAASVDGVFHPPYIETHLAVAPMVGQQRLVVLKGGGGEAERNPAKPVSVHLWDAAEGRREIVLPALVARVSGADEEPEIAAVWRGEVVDPAIEARIVGTVALGLMAVARCDERQGDAEAHVVWQNRRAIG
jgi:anthranilate phosphoribosyltransferase